MNRIIKFRAWDKHLNQFIYDLEFLSQGYWDSDGCPIFMAECEEGDYADCEESFADNFIIQQYTGLKDKNNKEIYEGDIVRYYHVNEVDNFTTDAILLCRYTLDNAWFSFCSNLEDDNEGYYWSEIKGNCEVIGNIHENPELKLKYE